MPDAQALLHRTGPRSRTDALDAQASALALALVPVRRLLALAVGITAVTPIAIRRLGRAIARGLDVIDDLNDIEWND